MKLLVDWVHDVCASNNGDLIPFQEEKTSQAKCGDDVRSIHVTNLVTSGTDRLTDGRTDPFESSSSPQKYKLND